MSQEHKIPRGLTRAFAAIDKKEAKEFRRTYGKLGEDQQDECAGYIIYRGAIEWIDIVRERLPKAKLGDSACAYLAAQHKIVIGECVDGAINVAIAGGNVDMLKVVKRCMCEDELITAAFKGNVRIINALWRDDMTPFCQSIIFEPICFRISRGELPRDMLIPAISSLGERFLPSNVRFTVGVLSADAVVELIKQVNMTPQALADILVDQAVKLGRIEMGIDEVMNSVIMHPDTNDDVVRAAIEDWFDDPTEPLKQWETAQV